DVENWPERINAVTAEQVNAALRGLVAEGRQIIGTLLPEAKSPRKKSKPSPPPPPPQTEAK
ncbi:MAG: hypothetical protein WC464_05380, partial [Bdellovibrionales bacterium]